MGKERPQRWSLILAAAVALAGIHWFTGVSTAQEGPEGLIAPRALAPFDPDAPGCSRPNGLVRSLVLLQDNARQFMQGVSSGLAAAAADRRLEYRVALADNNSTLMVQQAEQALEAQVGAVVVAPVDPRSMRRPLQRLLWAGAYVGAVVPPPATTILNAPQYLTGKALGDSAAAYIEQRLGGRARVVLLTHDSNQFLALRFVAMRDALSRLPGVAIVADVSPATVNREGGRAMMETVLLAHPSVDVVLGADTVVLGALDALRAAGKAREDQFLGGIDGEPDAVAEIKGGGPYKASVSLASPIFAYAMGQHAADWLEGKSIPQAMDILPRALDAANIDQYEADLANPRMVYNDPVRRTSYLKMYGNICHDSRDQYLNFPWSSELK
jgi:ribose transport system substrate-binding protein